MLKRNKIILISIVVVCLLVLGIVISFMLAKSKSMINGIPESKYIMKVLTTEEEEKRDEEVTSRLKEIEKRGRLTNEDVVCLYLYNIDPDIVESKVISAKDVGGDTQIGVSIFQLWLDKKVKELGLSHNELTMSNHSQYCLCWEEYTKDGYNYHFMSALTDKCSNDQIQVYYYKTKAETSIEAN